MPIKDPEKRSEYQTKYHREIWYPKNKERRKELIYENRKKILAEIQDYKVAKGCADCGYNKHPEALEFDHTAGKTFTISHAPSRGISWKKLWPEIEKCEVVCANCHRVRTSQRRLQ